MANTRKSAKNSFQEGLILDISPENMSATSMSSALNATLLTFNGNEMILQNDMGNGRVETAFLPEGYIPVGTCEFGDIIYIVSYNPLINKSQIGCFPSPERNISTEELGGLGQVLQSSDFQYLNGDNNPTGKLKATSVKKILYDNRDMTPGDKYIIYSEDLNDNNANLSDYGNTSHTHETFPKLVKIHVVSIEESGKIVYLDSTTRWYKNIGGDYYLSDKVNEDNGKVDLDSYRDLLSSGYSVFSSKVSGKLALLIELEKITGFSCAWEAYSINISESEDTKIENTTYSIYMHYNWTTEHNDVNPDGVALLTSEWKDGKYYLWKEGDPLTLHYDDPVSEIDIPSASQLTRYKHISRHYLPENIGNNYNAYLNTNYESKVGQYKEAYKLNINKNDGIPDIGNYLINCTKVEDSTYYGEFINAKGIKEYGKISPKPITDSIVNNYFHYPVIKKFAEFIIPTKQTLTYKGETVYKDPDITNLIYHYKIAPTMPYGILEEYAQEGYIDFSKLGKKHINLNTWKYYNYQNTSTFTWGMEAYTEPNKGIQEVVFEFYDNNKFVAAYHTKDKLSYNGVFTEYLTLNESGTNYKLNNVKAFPEFDANTKKPMPTYHKGYMVTKETAVPGFKYLKEGDEDIYEKWVTYDQIPDTTEGQTPDKYYMDDSGTLYSNCLYLVKIVIKYCNKNVLDEYIDLESENDAIVDYRWFWTNNMFNEYYYQEKDFKNLQAVLTLDGNVSYEQLDSFKIKQAVYGPSLSYQDTITTSDAYKSLSATIQYVEESETPNIKMQILGGLQDSYNTFNLNEETLKYILVTVYTAEDYTTNFPESPNIEYVGDDISISTPWLTPISSTDGEDNSDTSETFKNIVGIKSGNSGEELWETDIAYKNYRNNFNLNIEGATNNKNLPEITYISSTGEIVETSKYSVYNSNLLEVYDGADNYIKLIFSGQHLSKYYITNSFKQCPVLRSFVLNLDDLEPYNIGIYTNNDKEEFYYNKMLMTSVVDDGGSNVLQQVFLLNFNNNPNNCTDFRQLTTYDSGDDYDNIAVQEGLKLNYNTIMNNFKFLFPMGYGYDNSDSLDAIQATIDGRKISSNKVVQRGPYEDGDLGGTYAAYDISGNIEPGDHHDYVNMLKSTGITLAYLTQLFYLSDKSNQLSLPNNYIYLKDNYCSYKKDIIFKLYTVLEHETEGGNTPNDLIVMSGFIYSDYLNTVKGFFDKKTIEEKAGTSNVNIKLESCQKNSPLEMQFNYIKPADTNIENTKVIVQSVYTDIPGIIEGNYQYNTIYGWDVENNEFKHLRSIKRLRKFLNYLIEGNNISATFTNTEEQHINTYVVTPDQGEVDPDEQPEDKPIIIPPNWDSFSIGNIGKNGLLNISSDGLLEFSALPGGNGITYKVQTHDDRYLNNYNSNLKFYG